MQWKRLFVATITGALLGFICIIGASLRSQVDFDSTYLFSFWFNRVLLGIVIGSVNPKKILKWRYSQAGILGLFVSFSFWSATDYRDMIGFLAGVIYALIIEWSTTYFNSKT